MIDFEKKLDEALNDPLMEMESIMIGDVQFVHYLHPAWRAENKEYGAYVDGHPILESNDLWDVLRNSF